VTGEPGYFQLSCGGCLAAKGLQGMSRRTVTRHKSNTLARVGGLRHGAGAAVMGAICGAAAVGHMSEALART
jgi:hypothetical protein